MATGVVPRMPDLDGIDHPSVASYADVLSGRVTPGRRVAVIGAGGIGVDVSTFLVHDPADGFDDWMAHWGVGDPAVHPGGLTEPKPRTPLREVTLLQRKHTPIGIDLGKTSGWAHRAVLKQSGVTLVSGVTYDRVDDDGLHVTVDGVPATYEVDTVVVCAGQESVRGLYDDLVSTGNADGRWLIGGADVAAELDAKRAIEQGTRVAASLVRRAIASGLTSEASRLARRSARREDAMLQRDGHAPRRSGGATSIRPAFLPSFSASSAGSSEPARMREVAQRDVSMPESFSNSGRSGANRSASLSMSSAIGGRASTSGLAFLACGAGRVDELADVEEVGQPVEQGVAVGDDVDEVEQQPARAVGVDLEGALELGAVQTAGRQRALAQVAGLPALGHAVGHGLEGVLGDGLGELREALVPRVVHLPLRERALDRVAEAGDQLHVRVVAVHALEGAGPEEVGRGVVAGDLLAGGTTRGGVGRVVGVLPVEEVLVEEVPLLALTPRDVAVAQEVEGDGARRGLLDADEREADGQRLRELCRRVVGGRVLWLDTHVSEHLPVVIDWSTGVTRDRAPASLS